MKTLQENEIRPDHLRDEQMKRFLSDIRRLLKHRKQFKQVPCPACEANKPVPTLKKYGFTYVTCQKCHTMYTSPRPTPDLLDMYYSTSENYAYWNTHIFPASEDARRKKIFRPRALRLQSICKRYGVGRGTLLEVGAGFGTFCEEVTRLRTFKRVVAVEPTPSLAATCRKKGLEVIEKPVEKITLKTGSIDVIASFEVIEHLFRPHAFIRACASLLAPGGLLVLSCPNIKGFDVVVLKELSDTIDVEHLNYFHPKSLSRLVERQGFQILETLTPGMLDAELVRKKVLSGDFSLDDQPGLKRILLEDWDTMGVQFQKFLTKGGYSSHMWLVARKK